MQVKRTFGNLIKRLKKSRVLVNIAILFTGSFVSQVLGFISAPVLSRLYNSEAFGVFGSILAITSIVAVVSSLRYETALILEEEDELIVNIVVICFIFLLIIAVGVPLILLFAKGLFNSNYLDVLTTKNVSLVILIIFSSGFLTIIKNYGNRYRLYRQISYSQVYQKLMNIASQIIFGIVNFGGAGLLLGTSAGNFAGGLNIITKKQIRKQLEWKGVCWNSIKLVLGKHKRLALYSTPQSLINAISSVLPEIMLGIFYNVQVVGNYYLAKKISQIPLALLGQTMRNVFIKEFVSNKKETRIVYEQYKKAVFGLLIGIVPALILVFLFGDSIFLTVFGDGWGMAASFFKWTFIWICTALVNPPAMALFHAYGMQKELFIFDLGLGLVRFFLLFILPKYCTVEMVIGIFSCVSAFVYLLVMLFWQCKLRSLCHEQDRTLDNQASK